MFSAPQVEAAPEEDNRGILRVKIRHALATNVAHERAEAAHHAQQLRRETPTNRAFIYTGAFLTGLWNAGEGGSALIFMAGKEGFGIYKVGFGDLDADDAEYIASSLEEFLTKGTGVEKI